MTDLKVVQDWLESGHKVQSALLLRQFVMADRLKCLDRSHRGARQNSRLGVIAVQDESAALVSVTDALARLVDKPCCGVADNLNWSLFANKLTYPVRELAGGAHRIASGDFSQRIEVTGRTELADLGSSFNVMTDQIERFISDLQKSAEENRQLFIGTVKDLLRY
jgi:methyl-accepting chemotaxis protein